MSDFPSESSVEENGKFLGVTETGTEVKYGLSDEKKSVNDTTSEIDKVTMELDKLDLCSGSLRPLEIDLEAERNKLENQQLNIECDSERSTIAFASSDVAAAADGDVDDVPELTDSSNDSDSSDSDSEPLEAVDSVEFVTAAHSFESVLSQQSSQSVTEIASSEFRNALTIGSRACIAGQFKMAATSYLGALNLLTKHPQLTCSDPEHTLLLFALGYAEINSESQKMLLDGLTHFQQLIETSIEHFHVIGYYGLAAGYCKQNRFAEGLQPAEDGLALVERDLVPTDCFWPGTDSDVIDCLSSSERLKDLLEDLLTQCRTPPIPEAVCRYVQCDGHFKRQIYFTDFDFKGFVTVHCQQKCVVEFHIDCWRRFKTTDLDRRSDKEMLNTECITPDCKGLVCRLCFRGVDGGVTKEFPTDSGDVEVKAKKQTAKPKQLRGKQHAGKSGNKKEKGYKEKGKLADDTSSQTTAGGTGADGTVAGGDVPIPSAAAVETVPPASEVNIPKPSSFPLLPPDGNNYVAIHKKPLADDTDDAYSAARQKKPKAKREKPKQMTMHLDEFVENLPDNDSFLDTGGLHGGFGSGFGSGFGEIGMLGAGTFGQPSDTFGGGGFATRDNFRSGFGTSSDSFGGGNGFSGFGRSVSGFDSFEPPSAKTTSYGDEFWDIPRASVSTRTLAAVVGSTSSQQLANIPASVKPSTSFTSSSKTTDPSPPPMEKMEKPAKQSDLSDSITPAEDVRDVILSLFAQLLERHGPCSPEDPIIQRELEQFPTEAQIILCSAGGIGKFLQQSLQFSFVDGYVCLTRDVAKARRLATERRKTLLGALNPPGVAPAKLNPPPGGGPAKFNPPSATTAAGKNLTIPNAPVANSVASNFAFLGAQKVPSVNTQPTSAANVGLSHGDPTSTGSYTMPAEFSQSLASFGGILKSDSASLLAGSGFHANPPSVKLPEKNPWTSTGEDLIRKDNLSYYTSTGEVSNLCESDLGFNRNGKSSPFKDTAKLSSQAGGAALGTRSGPSSNSYDSTYVVANMEKSFVSTKDSSSSKNLTEQQTSSRHGKFAESSGGDVTDSFAAGDKHSYDFPRNANDVDLEEIYDSDNDFEAPKFSAGSSSALDSFADEERWRRAPAAANTGRGPELDAWSGGLGKEKTGSKCDVAAGGGWEKDFVRSSMLDTVDDFDMPASSCRRGSSGQAQLSVAASEFVPVDLLTGSPSGRGRLRPVAKTTRDMAVETDDGWDSELRRLKNQIMKMTRDQDDEQQKLRNQLQEVYVQIKDLEKKYEDEKVQLVVSWKSEKIALERQLKSVMEELTMTKSTLERQYQVVMAKEKQLHDANQTLRLEEEKTRSLMTERDKLQQLVLLMRNSQAEDNLRLAAARMQTQSSLTPQLQQLMAGAGGMMLGRPAVPLNLLQMQQQQQQQQSTATKLRPPPSAGQQPVRSSMQPPPTASSHPASTAGQSYYVAAPVAPSVVSSASDSSSKSKQSFDRIMTALGKMFPEMKQTELMQCVHEVRALRNNTLSGLTMQQIVSLVKDLVLKRQLFEHSEQRKTRKKNAASLSSFTLPNYQASSTLGVAGSNGGSGPGSAAGDDIFEEEEDPCIVCHEELQSGPTSKLDCGHVYHTDCIKKWFREQNTCPTCRNHALLYDDYPTLRSAATSNYR